jgi:hypothetical protein
MKIMIHAPPRCGFGFFDQRSNEFAGDLLHFFHARSLADAGGAAKP